MNRCLLLILIILTVVINACSNQPPAAQLLEASSTPIKVPATSYPTETPSPSPSPTPSPSSSPSPKSTTTISPIPSAEPLACWHEGGRIEQGDLRTGLLPLPLSFRIYLPPCYDQLPDKRYPVLYLIHGQNFNDDQWDRIGVDETANELIAAEEIPAVLIVMPRDRSWSQPTEDMFGQAVTEKLLPWIDQNYHTRPLREFRAIGGLSRGAGWALHLGLSHWDSFGAIGLHSLPVFWTDLPDIKAWLDDIPLESLPRIYMDLGDKDRPQISKSAIWFEELLTEKNIPHEWHLYPGYHEEDYWGEHVEEYLRWYTKNW